MLRTKRGAETLALCLVRTQPWAAAAPADGVPLELPARVSEARATNATTTTRRDRCEPRRMAGTLSPRLRPLTRAGAAAGAARQAATGATGATSISASAGMRTQATT